MAAAELPGTDEERAAQALIAAAGKLLAATHREAPEGFVAALFSRAVPEDLMRYDARELAELAAAAWSFLADRKPGVPKVRLDSPAVTAVHERLKTTSVLEIVNDDMPFLVNSVLAELAEHGVEVRLVVHPVLAVERDSAGRLTGFQGARAASGGALRESFIQIHVERIDEEARRAAIVRAIADVLADVRVAVQDWRAMTARVAELIAELKANPPLLPVGEIAEAIQFLEWLIADNFTFLGIRNYQFPAGADALEPIFESGLGVLRMRRDAASMRWDQPLVITPEIRALLNEPTLLIVTKSSVRSRVHRRVYMDYVGVKRFDPDGKLIGEFRIVGLFTSTAYTRSTRTIPYLRRKVDAVMTARRLRSGRTFRQGAGQRAGELSARRAVPDRRGHALPVRAGGAAARRAAARARAAAARPLRPLRVGPRLRAARALRQQRAQGDRRLSGRRLCRPRQRVLSVLSGRAAGARPFHHRPLGGRGAEPRPRRAWSRRSAPSCGPGATSSPPCSRKPTSRARRAPCSSAIAMRSRTAIARPIRRPPPSTISGSSKDCRRRARLASISVAAPARKPARSVSRCGATTGRSRSPSACRCWRTWASGWSMSAPTGSSAMCQASPSVWFHDMLLERADGGAVDIDALKQRLEACFLVVMTGGAESDGYNALVLASGLMWRDVALIRTISRFLRQIRVPYSQDYMWATLVKHASIALEIVRLFHARFDPPRAPRP